MLVTQTLEHPSGHVTPLLGFEFIVQKNLPNHRHKRTEFWKTTGLRRMYPSGSLVCEEITADTVFWQLPTPRDRVHRFTSGV